MEKLRLIDALRRLFAGNGRGVPQLPHAGWLVEGANHRAAHAPLLQHGPPR